jgi:hypothetical protein
MAWTAPRDYVPGEVLTATKLNEVSDNLLHLYAKPSVILTVRGNGINETTTSTTFTPVNNTIFLGSMQCTGAPLYINVNAVLTHSVANTAVHVDVLIDGVTYASSLTATAVTDGLFAPRSGTPAPVRVHLAGSHILPAGSLSVGSHSFSLVWRAGAAGTATLFLSGSTCQFSVSE